MNIKKKIISLATLSLAALLLLVGVVLVENAVNPNGLIAQTTYRILVRRGLAADLPALATGEFGFSTDTKELHIGSSVGNLRVMGDYITPEMYGAMGDGVHDDTAAIQAALNIAKGTIDMEGEAISSAIGRTIFLTAEKTYGITSPLDVYSGTKFLGSGRTSNIKELPGFSGTELVRLKSIVTVTTACAAVEIGNIKFTSTTAGVAAIHNRTTSGGYITGINACHFHDIDLHTTDGIILDTYAQSTLIENIASYGYINRLIELRGNWNILKNIHKEGNTGSAVGAYIKVAKFNTAPSGSPTWVSSIGNYLENILIEGVGSTNKHHIEFDGVGQIHVHNFWMETALTDGYGVKVSDVLNYVRFTGVGPWFYPTLKMSITNSTPAEHQGIVYIENADLNNDDFGIEEAIEIDANSKLFIENAYSRVNTNSRLLSQAKNITIKNLFANLIGRQAGASPGFVASNQQGFTWGQNLLYNPSFEAGFYGWTTTANDMEVVAAEVGTGLAAHLHWDSPGAAEPLYQVMFAGTIPAGWIGQTMTVSMLVKGVGTATSFACPLVGGAGITPSTGYNKVYAGSGWGIASQSFVIQEVSNLSIGAYFVSSDNSTDWYIDDVVWSFGTSCLLGFPKAEQIELGTNSIIYETIAPTEGTWKAGDICYKIGPSASGTPGWVCTTAGSPGIWQAMADLGHSHQGVSSSDDPTFHSVVVNDGSNVLKIGGYSGATDSKFISSDEDYIGFLTYAGNALLIKAGGLVLTTTFTDIPGTSATNTLALKTGVAPGSSPADMSQIYSADAGAVAGQAGPHFRTERGGIFGMRSDTGTTLQYVYQKDDLADDGTVTLPDATSGMILVSCNAEAGMWLVQADGTCTKISGSTNTANTNADGSLCVYDGGTGAIVKNRLNATGEIRIVYYYN
jgi:hypothetical protein